MTCYDVNAGDKKILYIPPSQVVDLSSGLMEELNIKMGASENEQEEDSSVLVRHQVCN